MTKKESSLNNEFLDVILIAIGNAILSGDTIVSFDGVRYRWDDIDCSNRADGYIIIHSDYNHDIEPEDDDNVEDPDEYRNWLTRQLYYHANKCLAYFDEQSRKN